LTASGLDEVSPVAVEAFRKNVSAISLEDWSLDPSILFFFTPEGWCYFLPSLLRACEQDPSRGSDLIDSFMEPFDRSLGPECWDRWFSDRLAILDRFELAALVEWFSSKEVQRELSLDSDRADRCVITLMYALEMASRS
jgi:hypothetical protein